MNLYLHRNLNHIEQIQYAIYLKEGLCEPIHKYLNTMMITILEILQRNIFRITLHLILSKAYRKGNKNTCNI